MRIIKLEELSFVFKKSTIVVYKGDEFDGASIDGDEVILHTRWVPFGKKHNMKCLIKMNMF